MSLILNHQTTDTTTQWRAVSRDNYYGIGVSGNFNGATVTIEQGMGTEDLINVAAQDSDLAFTSNSPLVIKRLVEGTYFRVVVSSSGANTDISVFIGS